MSGDLARLKRSLNHALSGKGAHVEATVIFEGLKWQMAGIRPEGSNHTIFQILNHLNYWQDWVVHWMKDESPRLPEHAAGSWPDEQAPTDKRAWEAAVQRFDSGLVELQRLIAKTDLSSAKGQKTPLEMIQTIASHNSYHLGEAVLLRQILRAWPPPSGGLTW